MIADALTRPLRSEAQVITERQTLAERAEIYERMLGYHEERAAYVARQSWDGRRGHYHGYMAEQPTWAPLPHTQDEVISATLHCDASAEFWDRAADDAADWSVIASDLVDSAETSEQRLTAQCDYDEIRRRINRAREFAKKLRAEHARRAAA